MLIFVAIGRVWMRDLVHVMAARRAGAVQTRSRLGQTVYRSMEPDRFRTVLRKRTIGVAVMAVAVACLALMTLFALVTLVAAALG